MFASDPNYMFYPLPVKQQRELNSQINLALRKVCSGCINVEILPKIWDTCC